MVSLEDYIASHRFVLPDKYGGHRTFEEFLDLNGIDENSVTQEAIDFYYGFNFCPVIERKHSSFMFSIIETLKSHPHEKLMNRIGKEFSGKYERIYCISNKDADALPVVLQVPKDNLFVTSFELGGNRLSNTKTSDKLYDILEFFNYYVTLIERSNEIDGYDIFFEPEYTKDILQDIKDNGGHVYHVTSKENYEKIKRTGLRPKVGKVRKEAGGYRYFTERTFLIGDNKSKEETIKNIRSVINDLEKKEYVIIDIDLSNYEIGLWEDGASEGKYNVYTYEAIPPRLISRAIDNINNF